MSLCKYSNIFGEPNKGLHSYSIGNIAVVDVLATALLASIFAKSLFSFMVIFVILVMFSYYIHGLFCVKTRGMIMIDKSFQ